MGSGRHLFALKSPWHPFSMLQSLSWHPTCQLEPISVAIKPAFLLEPISVAIKPAFFGTCWEPQSTCSKRWACTESAEGMQYIYHLYIHIYIYILLLTECRDMFQVQTTAIPVGFLGMAAPSFLGPLRRGFFRFYTEEFDWFATKM